MKKMSAFPRTVTLPFSDPKIIGLTGNSSFPIQFENQPQAFDGSYIFELEFILAFEVSSDIRFNGSGKGPLTKMIPTLTGSKSIVLVEQRSYIEGMDSIPPVLVAADKPYVYRCSYRSQKQDQSLRADDRVDIQLTFLENFFPPDLSVRLLPQASRAILTLSDQPLPETGFAQEQPLQEWSFWDPKILIPAAGLAAYFLYSMKGSKTKKR